MTVIWQQILKQKSFETSGFLASIRQRRRVTLHMIDRRILSNSSASARIELSFNAPICSCCRGSCKGLTDVSLDPWCWNQRLALSLNWLEIPTPANCLPEVKHYQTILQNFYEMKRLHHEMHFPTAVLRTQLPLAPVADEITRDRVWKIPFNLRTRSSGYGLLHADVSPHAAFPTADAVLHAAGVLRVQALPPAISPPGAFSCRNASQFVEGANEPSLLHWSASNWIC